MHRIGTSFVLIGVWGICHRKDAPNLQKETNRGFGFDRTFPLAKLLNKTIVFASFFSLYSIFIAGLETPLSVLNIEQLEVTIRLNRADIAKEKIFTEGRHWKVGRFSMVISIFSDMGWIDLCLKQYWTTKRHLWVCSWKMGSIWRPSWPSIL